MIGSHDTPEVPGPVPGETTLIQAGASFGDLTLLRQLGRGAQGVVWEAMQKSVGRRVAVKILPGEASSNEEQVERFHREAEAAGRLSHASIVAVYGFAEVGGHRIILQELVTGGSLEGQIDARQKVRPATDAEDCRWAAEICRQLAEALHHAHQHKVVHRDMKPGNVLMTESGVPKIADFGLAKVADLFDLSQTGAMMGTPHYMSPEQVSARQTGIDARTDVYSLGAVLYRMLTRQVPFTGDSLQKIFMDILSREPKPPRKLQPGVSADLEAVCLKALEKAPERRYADAQAFADDLQRYLRGQPTLARPVGTVLRMARTFGHLATSTLVVIAVLVPTAWFATDVLLHAQARADVRLHDARLVLAGCATLLLCWPLAHIGLRLSRGRRWAGAAACALALLIGAAGVMLISGQKTTQLHLADRLALEQVLRLEKVGARKSVADLEQYIDAWEPLFDSDDFMLMARGFLKRERPVRAGEWTGRLLDRSEDNPVHVALLVAVDAALGHDDDAAAASRRLTDMAASAGDWSVWDQIGSILLDMNRYADARDAWVRAGHLPDANRDRLNLALAQASAGLCEWEQANESLHDFMKWSPDDPAALLLALQIALASGRADDVDEQLARIESSPGLQSATRLQQRRNVLLDRGAVQAAGEHLRATFDAAVGVAAGSDETGRDIAGSDTAIIGWCGSAALEQATEDTAHAVEWLQFAHDSFARLPDTGNDTLIKLIGLAAADIKLAFKQPDRTDERLDDAIEQSRRAIAFDPAFYEGHHNLGTALLAKAYVRHGGKVAEFTADELAPVIEALQNSLQYNGLQPVTLNDTAYALSLRFGLDGDEAHLRDALALAQRAIALRQPDRGTTCAPTPRDRIELSACHDTLAGLHERLHDAQAALASAVAARDVLAADDPGRALREANIERLEALGAPTR